MGLMPSLVSINVNIFIWKIRVFKSPLTVTSLLLTIETSSNHNNSLNKNVDKTWTTNVYNNHPFIYLQWNLDLMNLYITNDFLQPGKNYSKMYGTELRFHRSPFNEILVIITTNTIQNPNRKIYHDVTNKCQHMIKMKDKQINKDKMYAYSSFKQFCLPVLEFLVPYSYIQLVLHQV